MSAGWVPHSMTTILRRRIAALQSLTVMLVVQEENSDDCEELLAAFTELRRLLQALQDISDGLDG